MYVCMYACMDVCMYVCMYIQAMHIWIYRQLYVCVCTYIYVYMCLPWAACMYVLHTCMRMGGWLHGCMDGWMDGYAHIYILCTYTLLRSYEKTRSHKSLEPREGEPRQPKKA